jgi:hypothetical protein
VKDELIVYLIRLYAITICMHLPRKNLEESLDPCKLEEILKKSS